MENKPIPFSVHIQGGPLVHTGYIEKESDDIICAYIDMRSKYCEAGSVCNADDGPELMVLLSDRSVNCAIYEVGKKDMGTVIKFDQHPGWSIFCATIARYTIAVTLIKK